MPENAVQKPILLVDDDAVDIMTVRRAFKQIGANVRIVVKGDGEEALEYLKESDELPGLILLDLNMPRMNGMEFLMAVKSDEALNSVPVIVVSASSESRDVSDCFRNSVVAYIVKEHDHDSFVRKLKIHDRYWTTGGQPGSGSR